MALEIRPYREPDRSHVIALWRTCGLVTRTGNPDRDIDLKLAEQPELLLVGCEAGRIVATVMVGYDGHRGWINLLASHPETQHQGIGRAMMTRAEAELRERGCLKVNLQVRSDNEAAGAFYEKLGYTIEPRISFGKRLDDEA